MKIYLFQIERDKEFKFDLSGGNIKYASDIDIIKNIIETNNSSLGYRLHINTNNIWVGTVRDFLIREWSELRKYIDELKEAKSYWDYSDDLNLFIFFKPLGKYCLICSPITARKIKTDIEVESLDVAYEYIMNCSGRN